MFPIPHPHTYFIIATLTGMILLGTLTHVFAWVFLGFLLLLLLAVTFYLTIPLGRFVRNQKIEFAWSISPNQSQRNHQRNQPVSVRCEIRYWGIKPLLISDFDPVISPQIKRTQTPRWLRFPVKSNAQFQFEVLPVQAGRVVFHGMSFFLNGPLSLFRIPLYFPTLMTFKVYPNPEFSSPISIPSHHPNLHPRFSSFNDDDRDAPELRPFQSGDAFRKIDWKTSAKLGKWYIKDQLPQPSTSYWIILDVGPSMRTGIVGNRKIDHATDKVASIADQMKHADKPIGLILVDGEVIYQVDPGTGSLHRMKILNTLIRAMSEIQKGLTQLSEKQIEWMVVQYFKNQFAIDLSKKKPFYSRMMDLLSHLFTQKSSPPIFSKGGLQNQIRMRLPLDLIQSNSTTSLARLFCRYFGIELPYRKFQSSMQKDHGIASALRIIQSENPFFSYVFMVTDFNNVTMRWKTLSMASTISNQVQIECVPIFNRSMESSSKHEPSPAEMLEQEKRFQEQEQTIRTLIRARLKIRKENIQ